MSRYEDYDDEREKLGNIIQMLLDKNFKLIQYDKKDSYPYSVQPIPYFINQLRFFKPEDQIAKSRFESLLEKLINNMNNPILKQELKDKEISR
jgi:hypothetical protein